MSDLLEALLSQDDEKTSGDWLRRQEFVNWQLGAQSRQYAHNTRDLMAKQSAALSRFYGIQCGAMVPDGHLAALGGGAAGHYKPPEAASLAARVMDVLDHPERYTADEIDWAMSEADNIAIEDIP